MNIGIFTDTYEPNVNGVVTSVKYKKRELENLGHTVFIIAPKIPKHIDSDESIIRLKSYKFILQPEFRLIFRLRIEDIKKIKRLNLDLILSETPFSIGLIALYIGKIYSISIVQTYHTLFSEYTHYLKLPKTFTKKLAEKLSKLYCNRCDFIISPSSNVKNELIRYGIKKNIEIIPTGIDITKHSYSKNSARKELGFNNNEKILLFVGRVAKEKNIEFLLDSYKKIREQYMKKIKFVIVGDGPYKKNLIKKYPEMLDKNLIILTGYLKKEDVFKYYVASDLFIFSSLSETQGLVILEALSAGLPVVAIKASGVEDVIENNKSGIMTDLNEDNFVNAILNLLNNNYLIKEMKKNAQSRALEFTNDKMVFKLNEIYKELHGNKSSKKNIVSIIKSKSIINIELNKDNIITKLKNKVISIKELDTKIIAQKVKSTVSNKINKDH